MERAEGLGRQEDFGPLDHGLEEGLELLFLSQEGALGIDGAFQGEARFWLGKSKESGAFLELEQGDLDVFSVHTDDWLAISELSAERGR